MRIVSLLPSATEMICRLGFESSLVARSHECDFPASVKGLPAVTESKLDATAISSEQIDNQVKQLLAESLSIYRVDADALRALDPDVVVTQVQCEVCAVSIDDVLEALDTFSDRRPRLVSLSATSLSGVRDDIRSVAAALEAPERGDALADEFDQALREVETDSGEAATNGGRPSVVCLEWLEPLMSGGNWVPELVELAGGTNLLSIAGEHSPWLGIEELVAANPEVIVVMPCGFDIGRTRSEFGVVSSLDAWSEIAAVQNERVYLVDGNQYFNRPGPRLADSARILAEIFHPHAIEPRFEHSGWVKA